MTNKRSFITTGIINAFVVLYFLTMFISCGNTQPPKTDNIIDSKNTGILNHDSLIKVIFKFVEPYFNIHSIDSIYSLKGKPQYIYKTEWGENGIHQDSLLTVKYPFLIFNFLQSPDSHLDLESIYLLDNNITIAGRIKIGKTTRQDILQSLGFPDTDHNDVGRSMTKSGDTTVYGTQSGVGDTVTFSYSINIDEYAIGFAMTKDTLRKITWVKNMN